MMLPAVADDKQIDVTNWSNSNPGGLLLDQFGLLSTADD